MKVLVAIDNKPSSQAIVDALIKMNWSEGTDIVLLTVLPDHGESKPPNGMPIASSEEMENLAVELRSALRFCEVSFLARSGEPKELILSLSEQIQADLIVVGSNCKNTLERLLLGSVCQSVLNDAKCPVIIAKAPCSLAREESPAFRNILVTIDNSVASDIAVNWLGNFSWGMQTNFMVVAVVDEDTDMRVVTESLYRRAGNLSALLGTNSVMVEIATGDPHHSIIELAKKHYSDLILMGSHAPSGIKELVLGRVSHSIAHSAPCALAVVHEPNAHLGHSSAAFPKQARVSVPSSFGSYRSRSDNDGPGHVMPGGF